MSVIDPLQQIMTLKIGETTNYTAGSAPTSTNGVIPNRQNWYGELYAIVADRKKKHLYQWLLDPKTLLKTIFTNGYFQAILSLAMVILKTIDF